jgi:hypothetical protein
MRDVDGKTQEAHSFPYLGRIRFIETSTANERVRILRRVLFHACFLVNALFLHEPLAELFELFRLRYVERF